jgi:hypothetical protein
MSPELPAKGVLRVIVPGAAARLTGYSIHAPCAGIMAVNFFKNWFINLPLIKRTIKAVVC